MYAFIPSRWIRCSFIVDTSTFEVVEKLCGRGPNWEPLHLNIDNSHIETHITTNFCRLATITHTKKNDWLPQFGQFELNHFWLINSKVWIKPAEIGSCRKLLSKQLELRIWQKLRSQLVRNSLWADVFHVPNKMQPKLKSNSYKWIHA